MIKGSESVLEQKRRNGKGDFIYEQKKSGISYTRL